MGVEESEYDVIYLYTVDTAKIGGQAVSFFWVCMAAALAFLIYFIYNIINYFNSSYASSINAYLRDNSLVSIAAIESDFSQAHPVGNSLWVGRKWTVYMDGPKAKILPNSELVWGYYYRRTGSCLLYTSGYRWTAPRPWRHLKRKASDGKSLRLPV